jgi:hypothetical protein
MSKSGQAFIAATKDHQLLFFCFSNVKQIKKPASKKSSSSSKSKRVKKNE